MLGVASWLVDWLSPFTNIQVTISMWNGKARKLWRENLGVKQNKTKIKIQKQKSKNKNKKQQNEKKKKKKEKNRNWIQCIQYQKHFLPVILAYNYDQRSKFRLSVRPGQLKKSPDNQKYWCSCPTDNHKSVAKGHLYTCIPSTDNQKLGRTTKYWLWHGCPWDSHLSFLNSNTANAYHATVLMDL